MKEFKKGFTPDRPYLKAFFSKYVQLAYFTDHHRTSTSITDLMDSIHVATMAQAKAGIPEDISSTFFVQRLWPDLWRKKIWERYASAVLSDPEGILLPLGKYLRKLTAPTDEILSGYLNKMGYHL